MSIQEFQLDFFEDPFETKINKQVQDFKDSADRVRKSQFAKIGALVKRCADLEERLGILERGVCRENLQINIKSDKVQEISTETGNESLNLSSYHAASIVRMYNFLEPSYY